MMDAESAPVMKKIAIRIMARNDSSPVSGRLSNSANSWTVELPSP